MAALELPALVWQVVLRDRPEWREQPAVLVVRRAGREIVEMASRAALAAGIALGQPLAHARALLPGLAWCEARPAQAQQALSALAEALQALSPAVEPAAPDALLLDVSAAHLVSADEVDGAAEPLAAEECEESGPSEAWSGDAGGDTDWQPLRANELRWAQAVLACVQRMGLSAQLAVSDTPHSARLLAASLAPGGVRLVPPLRQAVAVGGISLRVVARLSAQSQEAAGARVEGVPEAGEGLPVLRPESWAMLEELGIQRLARIRELPPQALVERLGTDAEGLLLLARGGRPRPLVPYRPPASIQEETSFESGVIDAQGLVFALRPVCERIAARLEGRNVAAARLLLVLEREAPAGVPDESGPSASGHFAPRRQRERLTLEPARPTTQARLLLDLVRDRLESLPLATPVTSVRLEVLETARRGEQLRLGERPRALEGLDSALTRLRARLGEHAVGSLRPVPHWTPEQGQIVAPFRPEGGSLARAWERSVAPSQAALEASMREGASDETGPPSEEEGATEQPFTLMGVGRGGGEDPGLPRPTRLLPPEPITPAFDGGGRLQALDWQGRRHRVLSASLPERLVTGWWRTAALRDYVRVLLGSGVWVWVFRDGEGRWWLQGIYD